jgi:signal transduction histidine kinase
MPASQLVPECDRLAMLTILQQARQGQTVTAEVINQHRDGTRFPGRIIVAFDSAPVERMIITVEDITAEKLRHSEAEAIEAERRRIAREIHDGVAQSLAGLRFRSALWSNLIDAAPPGMRAALAELEDVLLAAITDLRRAIFALRPLNLDEQGFFPALTQLVNDFGDQNQLAARLEIAGERDALPAAYELPLYRIIQESLNNIGQHARATAVLVHVAVDPAGSVRIAVQDDGRGFDPSQLGPADRAGHFGLIQMRERILDLNGTLDIHSTPGQGTQLAITLPSATQGSNNGTD